MGGLPTARRIARVFALLPPNGAALPKMNAISPEDIGAKTAPFPLRAA